MFSSPGVSVGVKVSFCAASLKTGVLMLSSPEHTHLSYFSNQTAEMLKLCSAEAMTSCPCTKNMPEGSDLQQVIYIIDPLMV